MTAPLKGIVHLRLTPHTDTTRWAFYDAETGYVHVRQYDRSQHITYESRLKLDDLNAQVAAGLEALQANSTE